MQVWQSNQASKIGDPSRMCNNLAKVLGNDIPTLQDVGLVVIPSHNSPTI